MSPTPGTGAATRSNAHVSAELAAILAQLHVARKGETLRREMVHDAAVDLDEQQTEPTSHGQLRKKPDDPEKT